MSSYWFWTTRKILRGLVLRLIYLHFRQASVCSRLQSLRRAYRGNFIILFSWLHFSSNSIGRTRSCWRRRNRKSKSIEWKRPRWKISVTAGTCCCFLAGLLGEQPWAGSLKFHWLRYRAWQLPCIWRGRYQPVRRLVLTRLRWRSQTRKELKSKSSISKWRSHRNTKRKAKNQWR